MFENSVSISNFTLSKLYGRRLSHRKQHQGGAEEAGQEHRLALTAGVLRQEQSQPHPSEP